MSVTHTAITNYDGNADWGSISIIAGGNQSFGSTVTEAKYSIADYGNSANLWYYDTADQKWKDGSTSNPGVLQGSSTGGAGNWLSVSTLNTGTWASETTANPQYVYLADHSSTGNVVQVAFENPYYVSSPSYSGTVTRHARSVTFPHATDFVARLPDMAAGRLEYEKYGNYKFRLSWFDQNEPAAGYQATIKWYSLGGQVSLSQQITADSGDITWQVDTNIPGWPIDHNSDVTLHFDVDVVVNGSTITAGSAVKTFTYLEFGPIIGTFTPSRGRPGDTISWEIRDTNPYPDYTSYMCSVEQEDGTSTDFPLRSTNAIPYGTSGAFGTTIEGVARLYEADANHRQSSHILAECVIKKMGKVFSNFW